MPASRTIGPKAKSSPCRSHSFLFRVLKCRVSCSSCLDWQTPTFDSGCAQMGLFKNLDLSFMGEDGPSLVCYLCVQNSSLHPARCSPDGVPPASFAYIPFWPMSVCPPRTASLMSVCSCCCDKTQQLGTLFLKVLEARSPSWRCWLT